MNHSNQAIVKKTDLSTTKSSRTITSTSMEEEDECGKKTLDHGHPEDDNNKDPMKTDTQRNPPSLSCCATDAASTVHNTNSNHNQHSQWQQDIEREHGRLMALQSYHVLDRPPNPQQVRLATMAARFCRVRLARIVLVDFDRCWILAESSRTDNNESLSMTTSSQEVARQRSVYDWAVTNAYQQQQQMLHNCNDDSNHVPHVSVLTNLSLPDAPSLDLPTYHHPVVATNDSTTTTTTAVVETPLHFFASVPLINPQGHILGVLAILDDLPRTSDKAAVSEAQAHVLTDLAHASTTLLQEQQWQLVQGVNSKAFQPNLVRSARFVVSQLQTLQQDPELQAMARQSQQQALDSACVSAQYLSTSLQQHPRKPPPPPPSQQPLTFLE